MHLYLPVVTNQHYSYGKEEKASKPRTYQAKRQKVYPMAIKKASILDIYEDSKEPMNF